MMSTVQVHTEPPVERVRLQRPEAAPVSGDWRQEGTLLLGQLAFNDDCRVETVTVTHRTETRKPSPAAKVGPTLAIVGGVALSVLGVGLLAAAPSKDHTVTCGDGSPREGERCGSLSGAFVQVGIYTLLAGVATGTLGVMAFPNSKGYSQDLPPTQVVAVSPSAHACGSVASLAGAEIAMDIPGGARWLGQVNADGNVQIDFSRGPTPSRGTVASLSFTKLPLGVPAFVVPGLKLGELVLERPEGPRPARSRKTAQR